MDKKSIFGLVVVGIIAYLWHRGKRSNSISADNAFQEVELSNLQIKESQLQEILEDSPKRAVSKINSLQNQINQINSEYWSNAYNKFSDYPNWARSEDLRIQKESNNRGILKNLETELGIANTEYDSAIDLMESELERQSFYKQLSLADIRQKLNDSGTSY